MKPRRIFFKEPSQGQRLTLWDKLKLWRAVKDKDMIAKLKSRKLWVTVGVAALSALLAGLGFDSDLIDKIVSMGMTYVAAQGLVDVAALRLAPPQAASSKPSPRGFEDVPS